MSTLGRRQVRRTATAGACSARDALFGARWLAIALIPACLPAALLALAAAGDPAPVRLTNVAAEAGITLRNLSGSPGREYIVDSVGNGAAFFDYDNDGLLDVLLVNGSTLPRLKSGGDPVAALYRNLGGGRFQDVTERAGLNQRGWAMGVCVADTDGDGWRDLYLTALGPNLLLRNRGDGTFADVTSAAGVGDPGWGTGCAFGDYDRDGDLDLYVANYVRFDASEIPATGESGRCKYLGVDVFCGPSGLTGQPDVLYRNDGDGRFTDVTAETGVREPGYFGFGTLFSDLDGDGWLDIYVANDSTPNLMFLNNRDGTFRESALAGGTGLSEDARAQAGMGVDAGDPDNDGRMDLFVTNFSRDHNTFYSNIGEGAFFDRSNAAGLAVPSREMLAWGTGFVDLDNDGWLDLFVANGHVYPEVDGFRSGTSYRQPNQVFLNQGNGKFRELEAAAGDTAAHKSSRGAAFGDYDDDGDIDVLLINSGEAPDLLRNDTPGSNHWVVLRLVGKAPNRDAIGARVVLEAGGRRQLREVRSGGSYLSHNDFRLHFGLGNEERVDRLEVIWPDGSSTVVEGMEVDRAVTIRQ